MFNASARFRLYSKGGRVESNKRDNGSVDDGPSSPLYKVSLVYVGVDTVVCVRAKLTEAIIQD